MDQLTEIKRRLVPNHGLDGLSTEDTRWLVAEVERLQTEAHACCVLLDGAAIEHSGRTLAQRVKNLVVRDDERLHDAITLAGERNRARAEVERLRKIIDQQASLLDAAADQPGSVEAVPIQFATLARGLAKTLRAALEVETRAEKAPV